MEFELDTMKHVMWDFAYDQNLKSQEGVGKNVTGASTLTGQCLEWENCTLNDQYDQF